MIPSIFAINLTRNRLMYIKYYSLISESVVR
jgi:hypothetical protein